MGDAPRVRFLAPVPERVEQWYREQHRAVLGEDAPDRGLEARCWNVLRYIAETGAPLEALRLVVNTDPQWAVRDNRTPCERAADQIGQTVRPGNRRLVFWVVPMLVQAAG